MQVSRVFISSALVALVAASLLSSAGAQQSSAAVSKPEPALDVTSMDRSIDPCVDFFKYSCGGWMKSNPIPPDQSSWDTYSKMQDENRSRLRGILEAASVPDPGRNAAMQKIGDYYASCTDEKTIEAKGAEPLKPALERIAKIASKAEIADVAAAMVHNNVLFRFELHSGLQRRQSGDRRGGPGRTRPAGPRLLRERRSPSRSSCAKPTWRTCRRCSNCWATRQP